MKPQHLNSTLIPIPQKVYDKWKEKQSRGDVIRIHEQTKISRPTIINALNHAKASTETILAISRFYSEKKIAIPQEIELQALKILGELDSSPLLQERG